MFDCGMDSSCDHACSIACSIHTNAVYDLDTTDDTVVGNLENNPHPFVCHIFAAFDELESSINPQRILQA